MKNLILFLLLAYPLVGWAQVKREGYALYEVKRDLHANLTKDQEKYKAMMPPFFTAKFDYFFNAKESIFKYSEEEDDEEADNNGMGARMRMMRPNLEIYLNNAEKTRSELRGGMGKDYLLEGDAKNHSWKLTDETAKVAGYDCKKATCADKDGKPVLAWYAESIPVFMGPMGYSGLPGLILKMDIDNGITICEVKKLTFQKNKENVIIKPTKGKKITEEEFDAEIKKMRSESKPKIQMKSKE